LNGVKLTEPKFLDDGTCTIKGTLTIREVVQVLTRTYRRYGQDSKIKVEDIEKIDTENRDAVLSETGQAIIGKAESTVSAQYVEKKTVVERVLSKGIAVTP
jgi:hypothetical protein